MRVIHRRTLLCLLGDLLAEEPLRAQKEHQDQNDEGESVAIGAGDVV